MQFSETFTPFGHIDEAISHYNQALDLIDRNFPNVDICSSLFSCLNKIQTEWILWKQQSFREGDAFSKMIIEILHENSESLNLLLRSSELKNFSNLYPPILDHQILRQGGYRPNQDISSELTKRASDKHYRLKELFKNYTEHQIISDELLPHITRLLYTVRSNIAHGEKTTSGPDLKKIERDNLVCKVTIPLQILLIDLLVDKPSNRLVSYGTLGPGEANNQILSSIPGNWVKCSICGFIEKNEIGLPAFIWNNSGENINANLFSSNKLSESWVSIDRFEGIHYKRRVIPVKISDKNCVIANIYMKNGEKQ